MKAEIRNKIWNELLLALVRANELAQIGEFTVDQAKEYFDRAKTLRQTISRSCIKRG